MAPGCKSRGVLPRLRGSSVALSSFANRAEGPQVQDGDAHDGVLGRCAMNMAQKEWKSTNGMYRGGLALVKKAPQGCVADAGVVRQGSTGQVVVMLPRVWAVAETEAAAGAPVEGGQGSRPKVEVAFYRKYTEAMLRKYLRLSIQAGRVPSLLGRELFRGNVTNYRVRSFEDVVVFCMDVERCLARLDSREKDFVRRIALQEYTQAEAACLMGLSRRHVITQYGVAMDRLTTMFLAARMLEPLKSCQ